MTGAYPKFCARAISAALERLGTRMALAGLRARGIKSFINTGTLRSDLPELLRPQGLLRYIDGYLGSATPKATNLRKAMRWCGTGPRETIVVGDAPDDLAAARAIGNWFVAITADQLIKERVRFEDPTGLVASVDRFNVQAVSSQLRAGPWGRDLSRREGQA